MSPIDFRVWVGRTIGSILLLLVAYLQLCCGGLWYAAAIDLKEVDEACYTHRSVRCDVKQNVLLCKNVQQTKWNISLTSSVTNVTNTLTHFISYQALLSIMKPSSNINPTARGICFLRTKSQLLHSTKSVFCRFLSFSGARLVYSVRRNNPPRQKSCQCVCGFDSFPRDDEATAKASENTDRPLEARSEQENGSRQKKNSEWIPKLDLSWIPFAEVEPSIKKSIELHFNNTDSPYDLYRITLLSGANCCNDKYARMINFTVVKHVSIGEKEKLVQVHFNNVSPGNYCVRVKPIIREQSPMWCLHTADEIIDVPFGDPIAPPIKIEKEKIHYVIIGVLIAGFALVFMVSLWRVIRRPTEKPLTSVRVPFIEKAEPFVQPKKRICIVYSDDCPTFVNVITAFSIFLENNFICEVSYAKRESVALLINQQAWIVEKLNSDIIIVVNSEGACLRQESYLANCPLRPRDDIADYENCVFDELLNRITHNVEISINYSKVFAVSFPFSNRRLKYVVPYRLYEIPNDLQNLCSAFAIAVKKMHENVLLTENDAAYQNLLIDITECKKFLCANPNYISQSFVPVNTGTSQRPDTITLSTEENTRVDDVSFTSVQSDSSKTLLWTM